MGIGSAILSAWALRGLNISDNPEKCLTLKMKHHRVPLPHRTLLETGEGVGNAETSNRKGKTMRFRSHLIKSLSVLVLLAVVNVFVLANGTATSGKVLFGKLVTTSNSPVLVNGGEAITGTTILSGAQLITPATGLATVQLTSLGTVMIAPKSNVTLSFDAKSVTVTVASGDATVTTADGVKGTVIGNSTAPRSAKPMPVDAETARNWGIAGVAVGSAAFIWALIAWNKANDADDRARALEAQLALLRACLARQTASPVVVCTSF